MATNSSTERFLDLPTGKGRAIEIACAILAVLSLVVGAYGAIALTEIQVPYAYTLGFRTEKSGELIAAWLGCGIGGAIFWWALGGIGTALRWLEAAHAPSSYIQREAKDLSQNPG